MRENRTSGSEGGGMKPIISPYPYRQKSWRVKSEGPLSDGYLTEPYFARLV
jgi:hypothetical protein